MIPITILRSNRKTISLEMTKAGEVLVRAPKHLLDKKIQEELNKLARLAGEVIPSKVAYYARLMGTTGGIRLRGRTRTMPPFGNEPFRSILAAGGACTSELQEAAQMVERYGRALNAKERT